MRLDQFAGGGVVDAESVQGRAEAAAGLAVGDAEDAEEQVFGAQVVAVGCAGFF